MDYMNEVDTNIDTLLSKVAELKVLVQSLDPDKILEEDRIWIPDETEFNIDQYDSTNVSTELIKESLSTTRCA